MEYQNIIDTIISEPIYLSIIVLFILAFIYVNKEKLIFIELKN